MSLPSIVPLFPLPNVVLFPQVLLPLHIFEPRYRQMVRDVSAGDELIGMILTRDQSAPAAEPEVYSVGCAGRLIRKVDLPDGRSNILLQGVREFECVESLFDRPYRQATVRWRSPVPTGLTLDPVRRSRLIERIRAFTAGRDAAGLGILEDPTVTDELLVNLFGFALELPFAEKQALLEDADLHSRAERLIETLEFHLLERELSPASEVLKNPVQ